MVETTRRLSRGADPFSVEPDAGLIRRMLPVVRRDVVEALGAAPGREMAVSDLAHRLSWSCMIGAAEFPVVLLRLRRDGVVTIDRTPGRVRVRLADDGRGSRDDVRGPLGDLAAFGLDLVQAAADDVAAGRARRRIADAFDRLAYGRESVEGLVRAALAPDVAEAALGVWRRPVADLTGDEARVLRLVDAGGRQGVAWSSLRAAVRPMSAGSLAAVVGALVAGRLVAVVERERPGSGRVGRRVVAL